jgi:diguanylate cyclase (GGDEF)-like protein
VDDTKHLGPTKNIGVRGHCTIRRRGTQHRPSVLDAKVKMSHRLAIADLVATAPGDAAARDGRPRMSFAALRIGVITILAAAVTAVAISLWRDRGEDIDGGVKESHNLAVVLSAQIEKSLQVIDNRLRGIQRRIAEMDATASLDMVRSRAFHDMLVDRLYSLPQRTNILVIDANGRFATTTAAWPTPAIDVADRDYFRELATHDDDRLVISPPVVSRLSNDSVIVVARRIGRPGELFRGIVVISVNTSHFHDTYVHLATLPEQTFSLLRQDGTFLLRQPDVRDRAGVRIPESWRFQAVVAKGGGSLRAEGIFDPVVRWIAVHPLTDFPLIVTVAVPEDTLLKHWRANALMAAAGTLILLVSALVLLVLMGRQFRQLDDSRASLAEKTRALERERAQFSVTLENMSQGIAMFDRDAVMVVCNRRYLQLHSIPEDEWPAIQGLRDVILHSQDRFVRPLDVDTEIAEVVAAVAQGYSHTREIRALDDRILTIKIDAMAAGGWVATVDDITAQRADEHKIRQLAHHDLLTGVANRPRFLERIGEARERLWLAGEPFNVMMLDLDHFKTINDSLGHPAGDALLKEMAHRLSCMLRESDVLARLGGDEFAIVQVAPRNLDSGGDDAAMMREAAAALANRIIDVVREPFDVFGQQMVVGASIGVARAPRDGREPEELMKRADLALYRAKSEGRNGYAFFEPEMAEAASERQRLEADLRAGLAAGQFELYFQPQVDVATRSLCGMEALVRWHHPTQGLIAPDRFISLAEDTGLIGALGEWIMEAGCREAVKWPAHVKIAINVSPVQFRKSSLFDLILCALIDSGLPPERLEIEITERVLLANDTAYLSTLHQLKNIGVAVALDDFGTGYSSLSYLTMFPFDKIKIDQSFTRQALERADCAAITAAIINLGRTLDVVTLAEGVETERQFEVLHAAGLDQAQGYLFGRPMPASEIRFDEAEAPRVVPAA